MASHGIIHYKTEQAVDDTQDLGIIGNDRPTDAVDSYVDECIDGYLILPKRSITEVIDQWALICNGDTLILAWVTPTKFGLVCDVGIVLVEWRTRINYGRYTNKFVWPIRPGLLPVPSKSMLG